jgi:hypothetical protein
MLRPGHAVIVFAALTSPLARDRYASKQSFSQLYQPFRKRLTGKAVYWYCHFWPSPNRRAGVHMRVRYVGTPVLDNLSNKE